MRERDPLRESSTPQSNNLPFLLSRPRPANRAHPASRRRGFVSRAQRRVGAVFTSNQDFRDGLPRLAERKHVSGAIAAPAAETADPPSRARPRASARSESLELSDVYRAHHRFVWRSVVRLGVPDERVADAVHDVFVVVARRLHEYEGRASIRTWLFAIALRVAQGIRRDRAREFRRRERFEREPQLPSDPHARADAARTLRDLLQQLDEDKRAVFIMSELEGMTAPEISAVVGCKVNTVYSRLRLARAELQKMIGERPKRKDR